MNRKKSNISLKIALVIFIIPFLGVSVGIILEYFADAVFNGSGSMMDLLVTYVKFIAGSFMILGLASMTFFYLFTRKIEWVTDQLRSGQKVSDKDILTTRRRLAQMPVIIVSINVVAYIAGFFLYASGKAVTADLFFYFFFPVASSAIYSFMQMVGVNQVLKNTRELLKIQYFDASTKFRFFGLTKKNVLLNLFLIMYTVSFILAFQVKAYTKERYNASLFEAVLEGSITLDQARESHQDSLVPQEGFKPLYTKEYTVSSGQYIFLFAVIFAVMLGIGLLVQSLFSKEILYQTKLQTARIKDILEGGRDLGTRLNIIQFDEIGKLSDLINRLMDKMILIIESAGSSSKIISRTSRSLDDNVSTASGAIVKISGNVQNISLTAADQRAAAGKTREAVDKISADIGETSGYIKTQASFIDETAGAMNEMVSSITSINEITSKANEISGQLELVAAEGAESIQESIVSITNIDEASGMVIDIITIMQDISSKTDLLAMNAAIEAAHAGDAGKGFAVVADEIRKLAEESSLQAREIKKHIENMRDKIGDGVRISKAAGDAFSKITQWVGETANLIGEISTATREQSQGAQHILSSVGTVVMNSNKIQELMTNLKNQSTEIDRLMTNLIEKAEHIDSTMNDQEKEFKGIKHIIENVHEISTENIRIVSGLQENLKEYEVR